MNMDLTNATDPHDPAVLLHDFLDAGGHLLTHALNALPDSTKRAVSAHHLSGGRLELRLQPDPHGGTVAVGVWAIGQGREQFLIALSEQ